MKKDLGVKPYLFPMPVLMVASYNEDGSVNVMNMAWGGICGRNMVSLKINENHKTSKNIRARGAFTISIADAAHIEAADFFGIASGNKLPDKFARSGLTAVKSEKVDAPVVQKFPLTLECRVVDDRMDVCGHLIFGEIVGVLADESVLDEAGTVDAGRLNALVYDQMQSGYYTIGVKIGQAWETGKALMHGAKQQKKIAGSCEFAAAGDFLCGSERFVIRANVCVAAVFEAEARGNGAELLKADALI